MRWADVELTVITHLRAVTGARVVSRLPANLTDVMPVVRVTRGPGTDDGVTDAPLVDVEVFAGNVDTMWPLAEDVREAMHDLRGRAIDGALIDNVTTATAPVHLDYENPAVQRAVASYRLAQRKSRTP
jgi:hypothetical protein